LKDDLIFDFSSLRVSMKINLLFWNVWNLPSCLTDGRSKERAKEISPILDKYDIACLNEAFVNKKELFSSCTHQFCATLGRQWYTVFDSGLVLLSRFPIIETKGQHFRKRAAIDTFAAKGVLCVRLQTGSNQDETLDVYVTHMQAGNTQAEHAARSVQSLQLADFINSTSGDTNDIVFVGDLNMGEVIDSTYQRHSVHYANSSDAQKRHESFMLLKDTAKLTRVIGTNNDHEDINHVMTRFNRHLKQVNMEYLPVPCDKTGRRLSDSEALGCSIELSCDHPPNSGND
jgi:hypothetical protein